MDCSDSCVWALLPWQQVQILAGRSAVFAFARGSIIVTVVPWLRHAFDLEASTHRLHAFPQAEEPEMPLL